jgi:hypothetical protein
MASGRRSKWAAPRIDPAEKAMSINRILCNVFSLRDKAYIPTSEKRLATEVATMMLIRLDNVLSLPP